MHVCKIDTLIYSYSCAVCLSVHVAWLHTHVSSSAYDMYPPPHVLFAYLSTINN